MTVYVDHMATTFGRMVMYHMLADTPDELHAMADTIGVDRKWFQHQASTPHYDICKAKRALAVSAGAVEVGTNKDMAATIKAVRSKWVAIGWRRPSTSDAGADPK